MDKLIVISTGGTGGHVFPALAMAEDLKAEDYKVIIIVDERGRKYLPANDDSIIMIPTYAISGNILQKIFKLFLLAKAILSTIYILLKNRPVLVIGFGGYASFPCCVSAILLSIPFALHEQNAILGKANFVLARFTNLIAISFENTKDILEKYKYKTKFVGNLVRKKIREISPRDNFDKNIFNILVIGGSQGASVFSNIVPEAFAALDIKNKNKINLSFQANIKDVERTKEALLKNNIKSEVKSFFDDIELKLQEADLVIARSGASTIAELEYLEKKAILVPLPNSAKNHQLLNALEFVENSSGIILKEGTDFTAEILKEKITELIKNRGKVEIKKSKAQNFLQILKEMKLI